MRRIPQLIEHEDSTVTVRTKSLDELGAYIVLHPEICDELLSFVRSLLENKGSCSSEP